MSRRNPEVERLKAQIEVLVKAIAERRSDPGDMPVAGCGDNSCVVRTPEGVGTNGGCRCEERELRRAVMWWRRKGAFLEETIRAMREGASVRRVCTHSCLHPGPGSSVSCGGHGEYDPPCSCECHVP